jgi:hypothetical protein
MMKTCPTCGQLMKPRRRVPKGQAGRLAKYREAQQEKRRALGLDRHEPAGDEW